MIRSLSGSTNLNMAQAGIAQAARGRTMNVTANINVQQISNGYVVSDGYNGDYIDQDGINRAETRFYPTLDELCADAGRFVGVSIENQRARMQEYQDQMKAERDRYSKMADVEANQVQVSIRAPSPAVIG